MTLENRTTGNPVKLAKYINPSDRRTKIFDIAAGMKTFKNQIPGTVVVQEVQTSLGVFEDKYYKCTKYKTVYGEPIWAEVEEGGKAISGAYYVFVNKLGTTGVVLSKQNTGNKKQNHGADTRIATQGVLNSLGRFYFQKVNANEMLRITGSANYDVQSFLTTVPDWQFEQTSNQSLTEVGNLYAYMRTDSNGRSGYGSGQRFAYRTDANGAMGMGGRGDPNAYRTDANGAMGFGGRGNPNQFAVVNTDPAAVVSTVGASGPSGASGTPNTGRGSRNSNTRGGGKKDNKGKKSPGPVKTVVNIKSKDPFTRANVDLKKIEEMPYMKQVINNFSAAENSRQSIERYHAFEMMPNSFEFSQLSSAWNEVARSGNYPLVDWSNYQLTKVSFRFLVVAKQLGTSKEYEKGVLTKTTQSIVNDGLLVSIDEQLENIRAMAGTPSPITLYNVNNLLTTTYRYPYTSNARNMQWVINDASITATRLTEGGKHISAAEVSLTLTEYPVIAREIIGLPPLTPDNPPPPACKPDSGDAKCTPVNPQDNLWVNDNVFTFLSYADTNVYPTGKAT